MWGGQYRRRAKCLTICLNDFELGARSHGTKSKCSARRRRGLLPSAAASVGGSYANSFSARSTPPLLGRDHDFAMLLCCGLRADDGVSLV